jgi:G3E family GTPase
MEMIVISISVHCCHSRTETKERALSVQSPLPVVVVTGLHQAQRRRAVGELLAATPAAIALHHDLSEAGRGKVLRRSWDNSGAALATRVPLTNDCPCCALREDLLPELARIAEQGRYRLAVVELWSGSDPQVMVTTIASGEVGQRRLGELIEIVGVVTAVDPARLIPDLSQGDLLLEHGLHTSPDDERTVAESLAVQVEYAGVLAISGEPGLDEPAGARPGTAMLRQLNPAARIVRLGTGEFRAAALSGFDVRAAAVRVSPALALLPYSGEADGIASLVWERRRPLHPARLYAALDQLVPAAQRSRGRFWLANRPGMMLGWDAAGGSLAVDDCGPWLACLPDEEWERYSPERRVAAAAEWDTRYGDRVQLLVFTAQGLDADGITELLDSCLLTDEELAAGEDGWKTLQDDFGELLDPVP